MVFGHSRDRLLRELDIAAEQGKAAPLERLIREAEAARYTDYGYPELARARRALDLAHRRKAASLELKVCVANGMRRRKHVSYSELKEMQLRLSIALEQAQRCEVSKEMWETSEALIRRLDEEMVTLEAKRNPKVEAEEADEPRLRLALEKPGQEEPVTVKTTTQSGSSRRSPPSGLKDCSQSRSRGGGSPKPLKRTNTTQSGYNDSMHLVEGEGSFLLVVVQRCASARVQVDKAQDTWEAIGKGLVFYVAIKPHEEDEHTPEKMRNQMYAKLFEDAAESLLTARLCAAQGTFGADSLIDLCLHGDRRDILLVPQHTLMSGMKLGRSTVYYNQASKEPAAHALYDRFVEALHKVSEKHLLEKLKAKEKAEAKAAEKSGKGMMNFSDRKVTRDVSRAFLGYVYAVVVLGRAEVEARSASAANADERREEEMHAAASRIQARFRGNLTRKKLGTSKAPAKETEDATPRKHRGLQRHATKDHLHHHAGKHGEQKVAAPPPKKHAGLPEIRSAKFGVHMPMRAVTEDPYMHTFTFSLV